MPRDLNTQQQAKVYLRFGSLLESSRLKRAKLYPPSPEAAGVGTTVVMKWRSKGVAENGNWSGKKGKRNTELEKVQLKFTIGIASFKTYFELDPH